MAVKMSDDTLAIVASNLTTALIATGKYRLDEADLHGSILHAYWHFCAELAESEQR